MKSDRAEAASTEKWYQRASILQLIGGLLIGLFIGGISLGRWLDKHPSITEVQSLITDHQDIAVNEKLEDHENRLTHMETDMQWVKVTLFNIAVRVGSTVEPPPP